MRVDLPTIASNTRETGTRDENRAIVAGSLAHSGWYSTNETERTIGFEIEARSFPNWNGAKQLRPVTLLTADERKWTNPTSSQGPARAHLAWN